MKKSLIVLAVLAFSTLAQAGGVGNGGDVLECTETSGPHYQILDMYEADNLSGWTYDFSGAIWNEIVSNIIENRLAPHSPLRAEKYSKWLKEFHLPSEVDFVIAKLNDVPDSNHLSIPDNCEIKQIAIQRSEEELQFGGKRYTIDKRLWEKLNEQQKAVLVLHEIVLREAISKKHENSIAARYFNSYLFSKIHLEQSKENIFKQIEKVFPNSFVEDIQATPFGSTSLLNERVMFVIDKTPSNTSTDADKNKRKTAMLATSNKYYKTPYTQKFITFSDKPTQSHWISDKRQFLEAYNMGLMTPDKGAGNLSLTVKAIEAELNHVSLNKPERTHIVILIDGLPTSGITDLEKLFKNLIASSKTLPVKFHIVMYAGIFHEMEKVAEQLNAKIYDENTFDQIEF